MSKKGLTSKPPTPTQPPAPPLPQIELPPSLKPEPAEPAPSIPDVRLTMELVRVNEENVALRSKIAELATEMARLRRQILEASEPELVRLAVSIAERVVGRELEADPSLVVEWARDAVHALASKDEVVIALGRDVAQQVPPGAWASLPVEHRVQNDALLPPGAVEVRSAEGVVAAGADARLAAVAQVLGVGEP
jgi:flagellar assembly protein FliH